MGEDRDGQHPSAPREVAHRSRDELTHRQPQHGRGQAHSSGPGEPSPTSRVPVGRPESSRSATTVGRSARVSLSPTPANLATRTDTPGDQDFDTGSVFSARVILRRHALLNIILCFDPWRGLRWPGCQRPYANATVCATRSGLVDNALRVP